MVQQANAAPIFILGVPRSGTTLLRMMIDSHPQIMCGPEAPWIAGRGGPGSPNLKELADYLINDKWGVCSGFRGVDEDTVYNTVAQLLDRLLSTSARAHEKQRWADKTPENVIAVPFLHRLFPNGKFVHLFRDGRDVALSTIRGAWKKINFEGQRVHNTYYNALKRWVAWTKKCQADARERDVAWMMLRYEQLVRHPEEEMRRVLSFVEAEWSDQVLAPYNKSHDVVDPKGEGIKSFHEHSTINELALYRWKDNLNWYQKLVTRLVADEWLTEIGYKPTL